MRGILLSLFLAVLVVSPRAIAGTAEEWLDVAADAQMDMRRREFAAGQILMLADSSASILISALRGTGSDSALRRQVAAKLLAESAPPEAEAALLEAAFGDDYFLAAAAKTALERLYAKLPDNTLYTLLTKGARERNAIPGGAGPGEEDWLALSLDQAQRRGAFKALVMGGLVRKYADGSTELPLPLTWQVYDGLLDPDPDLRLAAVRMLPSVARPEAVQHLAGFLYTENAPKILIAALRSMTVMRPPEYGEAVERHAAHADPNVAIEALAALDAMGYPYAMFPAGPGARSVAGFVSHPSTPVRRRAIELLIASAKPAALEYLEAALFDRVPMNRVLAAEGLGEMGLTAAVGALSPLLKDGRPDVRREAAVALSRLGVMGVASGVLDDLKGASPPFRLAAAEALGRIGDKRAVPGLLEGAESDDADLRFAAVEALGRLGDRRAGETLLKLLRDPRDPVLSDRARRSLAAIYRDDPGADPAGWDDWAGRNLSPGS